jgi:hypothetical protein
MPSTESAAKNSFQTILVDPVDMGTQAGTMLPPPPCFNPTPIREKLGEHIDPEGECCLLKGKPYILFGMWDYCEDWSGEFVREVHPFLLIGAPKVSVGEFWDLVRMIQHRRDLDRLSQWA